MIPNKLKYIASMMHSEVRYVEPYVPIMSYFTTIVNTML